MRQSAYDAYITREPHYHEQQQPHCPHCGGFLTYSPDDVVQQEQFEPCDGQRMVFHGVYTQDDAGLLDIIGWDKLGQPYVDERSTPCGDMHDHTPHTYCVHSWVESHWQCNRCGRDAMIVEY